MRPPLLVPLLAFGLMAGCVETGTELIEQAREDNGPQESVEGRVETPTDQTSPTAVPLLPSPSTPAPPPPPPPSPPTSPSPLPPPQAPSPPPSPSPSPQRWPAEGSFVRFEVESWDESGMMRGFADWRYEGGDWVGSCRGTRTAPDGTTSEVRLDYDEDEPPHWPLLNTRDPPAAGAEVRAWHLVGCEVTSRLATYDGDHRASGDGFRTSWDARTGLVLSWDLREDARGSVGRLAATDAPLAP